MSATDSVVHDMRTNVLFLLTFIRKMKHSILHYPLIEDGVF